jgi:hypothetical protein
MHLRNRSFDDLPAPDLAVQLAVVSGEPGFP